MSDENSSADETPSSINERPGNAQFVDLPRIELVDFTGVSFEGLFDSRREVYKLKSKKLDGLVDCHLCKLIFDYTKICKHYSQNRESLDFSQESLQSLLDVTQTSYKALSKITASLDVLSTSRVTSFTLTQNQFAELLSMYITKHGTMALAPHFQSHKVQTC